MRNTCKSRSKLLAMYNKVISKRCSVTSTNSIKFHHRKDSVQYNLQAAPGSQGPLKTNLLFWVRKFRWMARPISTPPPLQERVWDPFTAHKSAKKQYWARECHRFGTPWPCLCCYMYIYIYIYIHKLYSADIDTHLMQLFHHNNGRFIFSRNVCC